MTKKLKSKPKVKKTKTQKYSAHTLAIVLAMVLILEGIIFGTATAADWQKATTVLDVSGGVTEMVHSMSVTFEPLTDLVGDINQFYSMAATQMAEVLDISGSQMGSDIGYVYYGVNDFYQQAADQMMAFLDISNNSLLHGSVAGISIQR